MWFHCGCRKLKRLLNFRFLCFGFIIFGYFIYYSLTSYRVYVEDDFFNANYLVFADKFQADSPNASACKLPLHLSPFDSAIKPYIKKYPNRVQCKNEDQKEWTNIDHKGVLRVTRENVDCFYQFFDLQDNNDFDLVMQLERPLDPDKGLEMGGQNFVSVKCYYKHGSVIKSWPDYTNTHFWVNLPEITQKSKDAPSVLIIAIESLSWLNYLRHLPETKKAIEDLGGINYLNGVTKIADNTFQNLAALLTGKKIYNGELELEDYGPYDDWPFAWKVFKRRGYSTALIEDDPDFTIFDFVGKGFVKGKPTDWYPRPYWIKAETKSNAVLHNRIIDFFYYCFNERVPKFEVWATQVKKFMELSHSRGQPFFAFSVYVQMTHDDFNYAQFLDSHLANFFKYLKRQQYLSNTVIMFLGDHGHRYGPSVKTYPGMIEERMPLFAIRVPESLHNKYPHLRSKLESNRKRLATWLDVHQILMDVANSNYSLIKNQNPKSRSFSSWREVVPNGRTCKQSQIPDNFCVCDRRIKINPVEISFVNEAAMQLVNYINELIPKDKCLKLGLNKIYDSQLIVPVGVPKSRNYEQRIELSLNLSPSNADIRAQLFRTAFNTRWSISDHDSITRINKYGNQSHCIDDRVAKKYCFCKDIKILTF